MEDNPYLRSLSHTMNNLSENPGENLSRDVVQRLPPNLRGADFSDVRVHTNNHNVSNMGAKAFTQGSDIYFGHGRYNPNSTEGINLIAHELTHVVQQQQGKGK